ncbi:hypothetical protein QVZ41_05580 [Wenyingzhuangia sp. chi5]|uniref:RNA ligase n=1 Tax=Wenyingzhuangia gilva TaxID=3057677 RepID=A0ABT8VQS1_9FLAO|nr:hypothetical protein [Wenyingzhuangia sp. chi5]MDO3694316.1 hypothetical protein [Wenyingzhuangia sp. chi5]
MDNPEYEKISKKKPTYPIQSFFSQYLSKYDRNALIPVFYDDLLRFSGAIEVYNENGEDTLWVRVYYPEHERTTIDRDLKKVYSILHGDGSDTSVPFLNIDAVDYCTFGNSKPFRIKVRNILNDNYTYMYVKKADASRVYGLELEHLLSPNRINFLVYKETLIEDHISGIPGDTFIEAGLDAYSIRTQKQIAKEYVKFNERCIVRLLGDMRAYNYVIVPTHDFDQVRYRIRAIDFDQQCYEGRLRVYMPQFLKENNQYVEMVHNNLRPESIEQYQQEERSTIAKRILLGKKRIQELINCMLQDRISSDDKIDQLKNDLFIYTKDVAFKKCKCMGEILETAFRYVIRHYQDVNGLKNIKD